MNSLGFLVLLIALVALGLTVWGLFNRKRSLLCVIAGVVVALGAVPGMLHAWGEGRSIPGTASYAVALILGIVAAARQFRLNAAGRPPP
ncbi:MAG: hypothetical protein BWY59_01300 [Verrucomicrobia bacterium ADurb.Bin345]|nr:MAG: hypothetical protein BWY59_01300 [Verrucomicrobia bacterium ADurb.Bin345]